MNSKSNKTKKIGGDSTSLIRAIQAYKNNPKDSKDLEDQINKLISLAIRVERYKHSSSAIEEYSDFLQDLKYICWRLVNKKIKIPSLVNNFELIEKDLCKIDKHFKQNLEFFTNYTKNITHNYVNKGITENNITKTNNNSLIANKQNNLAINTITYNTTNFHLTIPNLKPNIAEQNKRIFNYIVKTLKFAIKLKLQKNTNYTDKQKTITNYAKTKLINKPSYCIEEKLVEPFIGTFVEGSTMQKVATYLANGYTHQETRKLLCLSHKNFQTTITELKTLLTTMKVS